jgi:FkbM family methyltransferase
MVAGKWVRAVAQRLRLYVYCFGFIGGARWAIIRALNKCGLAPRSVKLHPRHLNYRIAVRTGDSSDPAVVDNIFVRNEFAFLPQLGAVGVAVDLGSNIGCASALFLSTFRQAVVLAVEPDPSNFERCEHNLAPYGDRVRLVRGAVWNSPGLLVLSRAAVDDGREWAIAVRPATGNEEPSVVAYDMPSLLDMCPGGQIDLLKIDIEGGEAALFASGTEAWLGRVRNICIELHDPECRAALFAALENYRYRLSQSGEYTLCLDILPCVRETFSVLDVLAG